MQTVTILMGSPLSPILSNFYMVHIKIKSLTILPDLLYMFNILTNEKPRLNFKNKNLKDTFEENSVQHLIESRSLMF